MTTHDYRNLPYGCYSLPRHVVIHDRDYRPIVAMLRANGADAICLPANDRDGQSVTIAFDPTSVAPVAHDTWIEHDKSGDAWFYRDSNSPRRNAATREMLKQLVTTMPAMAAEIENRKIRK